MALYATTANINASGTPNVVDATSYNDSETTTTVLTTSYQTSSTFTPGAITITHIGVKLSVRTGTTGTITVALDLATVDVPGTVVTINCADLPVAATADLNGGFIWFKLAAPVLLVAATVYGVKAKTSSSSQVSLFSTATTNWARALITDATGTPGAGDNLIVLKEYTGAGTSNAFTLTWDITATTDFGSAPTAANSLLTPGIAVCTGGTLIIGSTAATNYNMKMSNSIIIYSGGTFSEASVATKMPRDSSFTGLLDCGANVDYGIICRNLGTWIRQGQSRTSGANIDRCFLNTDEAVNSTSLGVDTDTKWLDNDLIAVASTTQTSTQSEQGALNGAAGASTLTVDGFGGAGGGFANAHSGTAPIAAEVILLTRNLNWKGASTSLQGYISIGATAIIDWDWAETMNMGSNTAGKRGVDTACTTGVQAFNNCSFHDFIVTGSFGINMAGASGTGLNLTDNVFYNIANTHLQNVATSGTMVITNNIFMKNITASTDLVILNDLGGTTTNNTCISSTLQGMTVSEANAFGTFSGLTTHSNAQHGLSCVASWGSSSLTTNTLTNLNSWRNVTSGLNLSGAQHQNLVAIFNNAIMFGNGTQAVRFVRGKATFNSPVISSDSTFTTAAIFSDQGNASSVEIIVNSGDFDTVTGIKTRTTNTFSFTGTTALVRCWVNNTLLNPVTSVVVSQSNLPSNSSFVKFTGFNRTTNDHRTYKKFGTLQTDASIVDSPSVLSMKMTPISATNKLELSAEEFYEMTRTIASGQTATPQFRVYESATYNGARARLVAKRDDYLGITADTVLDTRTGAADAVFETMNGTSIAVSKDGIFRSTIDCDGTAGFVVITNYSVAIA